MPQIILWLLQTQPSLRWMQLHWLPQSLNLRIGKKSCYLGTHGPQSWPLRSKDRRRSSCQRLQLQEVKLPQKILWMLSGRSKMRIELQMLRMQKHATSLVKANTATSISFNSDSSSLRVKACLSIKNNSKERKEDGGNMIIDLNIITYIIIVISITIFWKKCIKSN